MKVFISGIGGYLGRSLDGYLRLNGMEVVGCSHNLPRDTQPDNLAPRVHPRTLEMLPEPCWFENCDAIIHCAYDPKPGSETKNIQGTIRLAEIGQQVGVRQQIFFSSHSARENSVSEYGRHKWQLERYFLHAGQLVLRPGMVIGSGGIFAVNAKAILAAPIVLLPRPKAVPVFYIAHEDLMKCVRIILCKGISGELNLFVDPPCTMHDLVTTILRVREKRKLVLSMPIFPMLVLATLGQKVFKNPPSILGRFGVMVQNMQSPNYYVSDLRTLIPKPMPLASAAEIALKTLRHTDESPLVL